jgi:predicted negative regulator of RcsB-dependent stress response
MADALAKGKKPSSGESGPTSREDAFVESTFRMWDWARKNLRALLLGTAGVAVIALGILYYVNFKATVREQAAADLARLRMSAAAPEVVIPDVETFVGRYEGTAAADEARVLLGRLYLESGRAADAVAALQSVTDAPGRPVGFAARSLLASALEASGDMDGAIATWETLGSRARFAFQRRDARASVARLRAERGELAEAIAIYEQIAEEAEDDGDPTSAAVYRIRLGELQGRLESGTS